MGKLRKSLKKGTEKYTKGGTRVGRKEAAVGMRPRCAHGQGQLGTSLQESLLGNGPRLAGFSFGKISASWHHRSQERAAAAQAAAHIPVPTQHLFFPPQESHEIKATHVGGKQKATTCWAGQRYSFDAQNCLLSFWKRKKKKKRSFFEISLEAQGHP